MDINFDIPGLTTKDDLISICKLTQELKGENNIILEIGSFCGKCTYVFSKNCPPGTTIFSVDHWNTVTVKSSYFNIEIENSKQIFLETKRKYNLDNVIQIPRVSPIKRWNKKKIDLLFLDGAHTFEVVYQELQIYIPNCNTKAIICGHDYHNGFPGLIDAVNKYAKENNYIVEKYPSSIWRIRKIIF